LRVRVLRDDDGDRHVERPAGVGYGLAMVPRARGDQAGIAELGVEARDERSN
jgi:hypothetical protein